MRLRSKLAVAEAALAASFQAREEDLQRTAAFWIAKAAESQGDADAALVPEVLFQPRTFSRNTCTSRLLFGGERSESSTAFREP